MGTACSKGGATLDGPPIPVKPMADGSKGKDNAHATPAEAKQAAAKSSETQT